MKTVKTIYLELRVNFDKLSLDFGRLSLFYFHKILVYLKSEKTKNREGMEEIQGWKYSASSCGVIFLNIFFC